MINAMDIDDALAEHVRLYHQAAPRLCARAGCPTLVTGPRRLYCSGACKQRAWYQRQKKQPRADMKEEDYDHR